MAAAARAVAAGDTLWSGCKAAIAFCTAHLGISRKVLSPLISNTSGAGSLKQKQAKKPATAEK